MREYAVSSQMPVHSVFTPVHSGLLQRKCACGQHAGGGECGECKKKREGIPPRSAIQTKLTINEPGDIYEQEADRMADAVVSSQTAPVNRASSGTLLSRQAEHRESNAEPTAVPPIVPDVLNSPGQALNPETRAFMEHRFGHDFSNVRIHTGSRASESSRAINAHAYTLGSNIVFSDGQYNPTSASGKHLLAHELTHVVQQHWSATGVSPRRLVGHGAHQEPFVVRRVSTARVPTRGRMSREEALDVLVTFRGGEESMAAYKAIEDTLRGPFTLDNKDLRVTRLRAAFSLLGEKEASIVLKILTKPSTSVQKFLRERFKRFHASVQTQLLGILTPSAAPIPESKAPQATHDPEPPSAKSSARWIELESSVFAYLPEADTSIAEIAAYVSGHPDVPGIIAKLNGVASTAAVPNMRPIIVPIEYIDRPEAIHAMPEKIWNRMNEIIRNQRDKEAFLRLAQPKSGHPLGPRAVGLIPLTQLAITKLSGVAFYALAFLGGLIEGFLTSIWENVSGVAKMIYGILKSIITGDLSSDIRDLIAAIGKLTTDDIKDALGGWAAGWSDNLNAKDPRISGHAHGYLTGYVVAEAAMILLTLGGTAALKGALWASKLGQAVKGSRLVTTIGEVITKTRSVAGDNLTQALEALTKSRAAKAVKAAEAGAAAIAWTSELAIKVLNLPADIAQAVAEKMGVHAKRLAPFFERIQQLSERAKRWLFGCNSPCDWEPAKVEETLTRLAKDADVEAAAERAATKAPATAPSPVPKPPREPVAPSPEKSRPAPSAAEHHLTPPPKEPATLSGGDERAADRSSAPKPGAKEAGSMPIKRPSGGATGARVARDPQAFDTKHGSIIDPGYQGRLPDDPPLGHTFSKFEVTTENLKDMLNGKPPIGPDGYAVELHHRTRGPKSRLDEYTSTQHDELPLHERDFDSLVDRAQFAKERARYWVSRARRILGIQDV